MIVVDLGYYGHGMYDSISSLITAYSPDLVFGFDPMGHDAVYQRQDVTVVTSTQAAWTKNGVVPFQENTTSSRIGGTSGYVLCFDLAAWLKPLPQPIVVKMDVEGAEFDLCAKLKRTGVDKHLNLLLVETHGTRKLPKLACPVEEWWM